MHALVIRAGEDAWLNLSQWALNWMHRGRHGARSRPKGTQTDLCTESTQPSTAQLEAIALQQNDISDFVRGSRVPVPDWKSVFLRSRLNHNMEEVQPPENVTWQQLLPGLPPNRRAVQVRLIEVVEGPLREQLMSPASVLLPEKLWPPVPPGPRRNIWKFAEGVPKCACSPFSGPVTCCKPTGNQFSMVSWRGTKKRRSPAQRATDLAHDHQRHTSQRVPGTLELRHRQTLLLCSVERDRVEPVLPSGVMVGGRDVGSFLDIPQGTKLVSMAGLRKKIVPGSFAAQWCPELASESLVYPAMMMGWKSACNVLQHAHRRLCFAQLPQVPVCQPTVKYALTGRCRRRLPASWGRL